MSAVVDIWVDLRNRKLVSGIYSNAAGGVGDWLFPTVWHHENINLRWHFLSQNQALDPRNPNTLISVAGAALAVYVFDSTGVTTLANTLAGGWTIDAAANTISGQINLATAPMDAAFGAGVLQISAWLELQLTLADGAYVVRFPIYIQKSFIAAAVPGNITGAAYLTREESIALFVKYYGNPNGSTITLPSPDGAHQRVVGERNDGSTQDDVI